MLRNQCVNCLLIVVFYLFMGNPAMKTENHRTIVKRKQLKWVFLHIVTLSLAFNIGMTSVTIPSRCIIMGKKH